MIGAHQVPPLTSCEHNVPPQHRGFVGSHGSPALVHAAAGGEVSPGSKHTEVPGAPSQRPAQQSAVAEQRAPIGAHSSRHEKAPSPAGRQRPTQHCSGAAQAAPDGRQATPLSPERQRMVGGVAARHPIGPPAQHSPAFPTPQVSPVSRHFFAAQRATPSGPTVQAPEQQSTAEAQRSPLALHPPVGSQRRTPASSTRQTPEQHSPSIAQRSWATRHMGSALHTKAPSEVAVQRPLQQSPGRLQVSPATRHCWINVQRIAPPSAPGVEPHEPPQHSSARVHSSPAARQPGTGPHFPSLQRPLQHWRPSAQLAPLRVQFGPPLLAHVPVAMSQPKEQQAPARAHAMPGDEQPAAARHTGTPCASSLHRNEQQSSPVVHVAPSGAHAPAGLQTPSPQRPEQQAGPVAQLAPLAAHSTTGGWGFLTSSKVRRHPAPTMVSSAATTHAAHGARPGADRGCASVARGPDVTGGS